MSNQKYSDEVNLDHPVTDEQDDDTCLHFHELPPILHKCPYIISPDNDAPPDQDNQ